MAPLSADKLNALKRAFTQDALLPSQAAQRAGVTYATAKRYYDLWGERKAVPKRLIRRKRQRL